MENKDKKDIKEEVKEEAVVEAANNTELDGMFDVDPFERNKAAEESGIERSANVTVFKTNIPVVKRVTTSKTDGKEYANYRVAWQRPLYGKKVLYELNLIPSEKRKVLYDILDAMYADKDRLNLEIIKTISTNTDNEKVTRYTMRLSVIDEGNVEINCPMRPAGTADRAVFEVLLSLLKDKGVIS